MRLGRRWSRAQVRAVRRRFRSRIDRFKRTRKAWVKAQLLADPEIAAAARDHAAASGEAAAAVARRVAGYVDEIVPSFSLLSYYRVGYAAARALLPLFYKVGVEFEDKAALDALPRDAVSIYLFNHRSNADYVLAAFALSEHVALSYAVGEWARVWPLEPLFKSFGSYFVRRGCREALYHKVLERYVQLITRNGVTQGIFLEGCLSRDGRLREPKLGLLDCLVRVAREPGFARPIHVVPAAINYDRVLEDRSLLREIQAPEARSSRREQLGEVLSYVTKVSARFLLRRARRYGRACIRFGRPLSVSDWLASRPGVLELPRDQRLPRIRELADQVMGRIAGLMPVTAVPLASAALLQAEGAQLSRAGLEAGIDDVRFVLRGAGAACDERDSADVLERALVMLTLRHVVACEGDRFRVDHAQDRLLSYYANSIAHFLGA